jgi:hypothetical protein
VGTQIDEARVKQQIYRQMKCRHRGTDTNKRRDMDRQRSRSIDIRTIGQASRQMNRDVEEQKGIHNFWTDGQTEKS